MLYRSYQSYCHRLQHDMYFLTSTSRLNEQVVDKIVLQLNRVYPQILTNEEAEKFRNPKASLHTRLSDLLKHLQKKGDRHCQEFYRALQINAEQLFNDLPSRKILKVICIYPAQTDGGPFSCLHGEAAELPHILNLFELGKSGPILPQNLR
ncbi:caspase recruitment domain-containing protein 19 isoform X5 [Haemorhous mexicanus]|uniref:caspase recruitment domain-containing protein 19 isoform X5 n=1 Tax=Haemorhous mexicanus TaxID=30427 RepID=UPI0028BEFC8C|nr:caspase recruitment domain-containing protein 19 isoform X5 [Haemorhous mexicanus]